MNHLDAPGFDAGNQPVLSQSLRQIWLCFAPDAAPQKGIYMLVECLANQTRRIGDGFVLQQTMQPSWSQGEPPRFSYTRTVRLGHNLEKPCVGGLIPSLATENIVLTTPTYKVGVVVSGVHSPCVRSTSGTRRYCRSMRIQPQRPTVQVAEHAQYACHQSPLQAKYR
jgi:hypothetical protein